MIWDLHCHFTGLEGRTPDERMANLIEYADRMGVDKVTIFMGIRHSLDPTPEVFRRENDEVMQALSHWHDRAFGFAYVNPNYPDESVAEMDRMIADGPMVGIKLWVACRCSDPKLDAIVTHAAKLKAVIFQHTWYKTRGNLPGESTPEDLVVLAKRFPEIPFICGHSGGNWELGIRAIRRHPNIMLGTGGFDPTAGMMEMAVRELGADRIIYGSDAGGRSFASQLAKVQGADIDNAAKKMILGRNYQRLLQPILNDKVQK